MDATLGLACLEFSVVRSFIIQYLLFQATTDLYGNCTLRHSGTSAAAPEAAGVFALALEAKYVSPWSWKPALKGRLVCVSPPTCHGDRHGCERLESQGPNESS